MHSCFVYNLKTDRHTVKILLYIVSRLLFFFSENHTLLEVLPNTERVMSIILINNNKKCRELKSMEHYYLWTKENNK